MIRVQPHLVIGLFTLLTLILAGAAIRRLLGLPAGEGAYLMLVTVVVLVWLVSRHLFHKEQ